MSKSEGRNGPKTRWRRRVQRVRRPRVPLTAEVVAQAVTPASASISAHRYLQDDAWQFPHPTMGGREAVFEILIGPISRRSVLVPTCNDPLCVNPQHCEIENREVYAAKQAGTYDPYIIAPDGRPIRRSEFEKTLRLHKCRITSLDKTTV